MTTSDPVPNLAQRPSLDRIAKGLATVLDVPLVVISVVDRHRQVVVGAHGLAASGSPHGASSSPLCHEVASSGRPVLVQDARRRTQRAACYGGGFELVAYAGVPVAIGNGTRVGVLAAFAPIRRSWQDCDLVVLRSFAEAVGAILDMQRRCDELRDERHVAKLQLATASAAYASLESRAADVAVETAERERIARADHTRSTAALESTSVHDELTGLLNRRGLFAAAEVQLAALQRRAVAGLLLYVDVDGLKTTNDESGHAAGDDLLRAAASVLRCTFRGVDTIARLGGDEFVVIATDMPASEHALILGRLGAELARSNSRQDRLLLAWSLGVVAIAPGATHDLDALLFEADRRMYAAKRASHHLSPVASTGDPAVAATS